MTNYEVCGLTLSTYEAGVESLCQLVNSTAATVEEFCVETHIKDMQVMKLLAQTLPSERYAFYGWARIDEATDYRLREFTSLGEARFVFAKHEVSVDTRHVLPVYDWDGKPIAEATITFIEKQIPSKPERSGQNQLVILALVSALREAGVDSDESKVRTSRSWSGEGCDYAYLVGVPIKRLDLVLEAIFGRFGLKDGVGSFEFLGNVDRIEAIHSSGRYASVNFPRNAWSLNAGTGKTSFALERASFLYPILNVRKDQLPVVASVLDSLGTEVTRCSIVRKYLSWNLGKGAFSPRTQGNYVMLSRQKMGYALLLGFDQYANEDPPVKEFKAAVSPVLKGLGAKLKSIPHIK